ncbi:MAG: alpha/beta hydrolase [Acidobacteriota bacterium]
MSPSDDPNRDVTGPTRFDIHSGDVRLQGYDYGGSVGPPLVLLHGMQDFALSLDPLARALAEGHRVIAFDLRGHGDSDKPGLYTLPHMIADLHAVILQLGLERPRLVGHSLGGQIVSQYAAVFPEIPSCVVNVEGIGGPMREEDIPAEDRQWRLRGGIEGLLHPGGRASRPMVDLQDASALFLRFHPGMDPAVSDRLAELGSEPHPHGGLRWKWDQRVQSLGLTSNRQAAEERWGWIECPVLVVTAGQAAEFFVRQYGMDPDLASSAPEEIPRRVGLFRSATHVEIPEAGHMVHFDTPDRLEQICREFLSTI